MGDYGKWGHGTLGTRGWGRTGTEGFGGVEVGKGVEAEDRKGQVGRGAGGLTPSLPSRREQFNFCPR